MSSSNAEVEAFVDKKYKHGWVTDIESDTFPPGLDENVIRAISARKGEPAFMLEWRLKAFETWKQMAEPEWAHVDYPKIDYQAISYFSAPKSDADKPKSLDEV
ncbi:MAG: Fe-S cluster assembly protein SufB, partial [Pseudomonadota bacterium]